MYPIARMDRITIKKLGDELVVFDASNGSVHHLNRVAEIVWRACDGRTDVPALGRIVSRAIGVADNGPAVELALEQLSRRGLLSNPIERATPDRRRDRRAALKQLAMALAIPTILTVTAGKARAQFKTGDPCAFQCPGGATIAGVFGPHAVICIPIIPCPIVPGTTTTTTTTTGGEGQ